MSAYLEILYFRHFQIGLFEYLHLGGNSIPIEVNLLVYICFIISFPHQFEFFLNNTNLTFLAFLYKIDIQGFQNQQKIKLPLAGIELTTPTIYGLEF